MRIQILILGFKGLILPHLELVFKISYGKPTHLLSYEAHDTNPGQHLSSLKSFTRYSIIKHFLVVCPRLTQVAQKHSYICSVGQKQFTSRYVEMFFSQHQIFPTSSKILHNVSLFSTLFTVMYLICDNITRMEADVLATSSHLVCFNITEENKGNAEKHRVMQVGDRYHHGYFSREKIIFREPS